MLRQFCRHGRVAYAKIFLHPSYLRPKTSARLPFSHWWARGISSRLGVETVTPRGERDDIAFPCHEDRVGFQEKNAIVAGDSDGPIGTVLFNRRRC